MRLPIRFYIPILAILVACGGGAVYLHLLLSLDKSKTVEFGAAVVGGITALYGLMLSIHQRRTTAAARFVERWNSTDFAKHRGAIRKSIEHGPSPDADYATAFMFSFWEEMAIAVMTKEADERLLKQFFFSIVLRHFTASEEWLRQLRKDKAQPTAFIEYEKLCARWRPTGT
jgi:hypothetical protein